MVGYLAKPWYRMGELDPASCWFARLCGFPKEDFVSSGEYLGVGRGNVESGGRRGGRIGVGMYMKSKFF